MLPLVLLPGMNCTADLWTGCGVDDDGRGAAARRSCWIRVRISCTLGRSSGSGARHSRSSPASGSATPETSNSPRRTRSMIAIPGPLPYGGRPVAANTTVAAHACTSEATVASSP